MKIGDRSLLTSMPMGLANLWMMGRRAKVASRGASSQSVYMILLSAQWEVDSHRFCSWNHMMSEVVLVFLRIMPNMWLPWSPWGLRPAQIVRSSKDQTFCPLWKWLIVHKRAEMGFWFNVFGNDPPFHPHCWLTERGLQLRSRLRKLLNRHKMDTAAGSH